MLKNKVVLITGGSRGIGKGIVEKFSELGAKVAFSYLSSSEEALTIVKKVSKNTVCKTYQSDVSNFDEAQQLINQTVQDFGTIDILINNAGITKDNLLLRMDENAWDQVINTNLKSCFNTTKALLKLMIKKRSGSIINISSVVGIKGNAGQVNYAASKSGIIGFTKSLALELGARGIRVNCVAPGFIETEMTNQLEDKVLAMWRENIPLKRGGTPLDIANACAFLASEDANYITGQVIQVDGGMLT